MINVPFKNTYARLPEDFYSKTDPSPVDNPILFKFNLELAEDLGITIIVDGDDEIQLENNINYEEAAEYFSGNKILEGSEPIAMVYSGHQFGNFSPQLGDGRAILLGEVKNKDGIRYDIQLKGSGRTPWSRGGDGRSALGPVIREYLLSEAMYKLGVPTTRALAAVTTGEQVAREKLTPGGIITRVAKGFVRVGTFQYFASQGKVDELKKLVAYVIGRHYPEAKSSQSAEVRIPAEALLKAVINAQAKLIAKWMSLGFIHGVMNTDNVSIAGETIDYGPCAFMDEFSHDRVYSSIDRQGRYAYQNQPQIGQWNLIRFAETLLPIFAEYIAPEEGKPEEVVVKIAQECLNEYEGLYKNYWLNEMRQKLGLVAIEVAENIAQQAKAKPKNISDHALVTDLLEIMQAGKADFTLTFHYLSQGDEQLDKVRELFENPDNPDRSESVEQFDDWVKAWKKRLIAEKSTPEKQQALMQSVNPAYIPRNHQVEAAIRAAEDHNDFSKFDELHKVLQTPFTLQSGMEDYLLPPKPEEVVLQTFCGT